MVHSVNLEKLTLRMSRLERSNRLLMLASMLMFALLLGTVSIAWTHQKSTPDVQDSVITRNIRVVAENGQTFIEMSVDTLFGPEIVLFDEFGNVQVEMTAWPEGLGGKLNFYDEDGDRALELGYLGGWDAGLKLNDWDGATRAMLTFWGGSSPRLAFYNSDGESTGVSLGMLDDDEPELAMYGSEGETLYYAP